MARKGKYYSSNMSSLQNAAKTLLANIRFSGVDEPIKSVMVTSSVPDEGKSTIAEELARAVATSGKSVILVECDMRRRTLADRIGARASHGLYSVLSHQADLVDAVVPLEPRGMYFLDCEPSIPNPSDVLASRAFSSLIKALATRYDYVVFDTPPVGAFVDAAVLSAQVDATLLVARERYVKRAELQAAYEQLEKAGANVIGIVMNHVQHKGSSYYYSNYYESGSSKDSKSATAMPAQRTARSQASQSSSHSSTSASSGKSPYGRPGGGHHFG